MSVDKPDAAGHLLIGEHGATDGPTALGRKRKSPDDDASPGSGKTSGFRSEHVEKKTKLADVHAGQSSRLWPVASSPLSRDRSLLPPEIWHHVFTFCPPKTLGNLLPVNKLFNFYLDPSSSFKKEPHPSASLGALGRLEPNAIWQASRRLFWPQLPAPLRSKTELEMWRLACSPRCQVCGKLPAQGSASRSPRHPGPCADGVAAIWAFGIRTCAACLLKGSEKEVDLEISPSIPSAIVPALPFVFLTQERGVLSPTTLESSQPPGDMQLTKLFSKQDIEALLKEFLQVKDMGQGTVAEWLKGLPGRGASLQHEAAKWEKWELSGGVVKMCSLLYPGYESKTTSRSSLKSSVNPAITSTSAHGRHERTAEEAAELKAARRAEIERRCLLLSPPLTADVLRHIPSFQAATQIVADLTDDAWERLKPRLLAQRAEAEKNLEAERVAGLKDGQQTRGQSKLQATLAADKEARDRVDKEWEDVQAPLRVKIAGYADEVLREKWGKGKKVTRENCSRFAVDSLLYVRERFYADIARDVAEAKAAGKTPTPDPPNGPFTQKLTLENMKWIFDTKFKPHTEPLRKELFYCNGCEGNYKAFGFEGVIQHYAAKHTSALSLGSIVVYWRAEWPEHPPFCAAPRSAKPASTRHTPGGFAVNGGVPPPVQYGYAPSAAVPMAPPPLYPPPMGYGYTPPPYNVHYPQPPPPPPPPYQPPPTAPPLYVPPPDYEPAPSPYIPLPAPYSAFQPPAITYTTPVAEPVSPSFVPTQSGQDGYLHDPYPAHNAATQYTSHQPSPYPSLYQTKVDDIARNARDVWRTLGDIRDLPGDIRVFTTIHHLVKRFQSRFYETPPLSMFIDGLSNNREMRPVRNVNGLACRACRLGLGNAASAEEGRKEFSLPQLSNHFQSKHIEPLQRSQAGGGTLNWVTDMVLVSDLAALPGIISSANEPQKALLSAAFPAAFETRRVAATGKFYSPQTRQHKEVLLKKAPTNAPDTCDGSQADSGGIGRSGIPGSMKATTPADRRSSGKSPHSTMPSAPENDRSAHSGVGRQLSHSSGHNLGPSRFNDRKRTSSSKSKRGESQGRSFSSDREPEMANREDEETKKPKDEDGHTVRPAGRASTPPPGLNSTRPEKPGMDVGLQDQRWLEQETRASRRPDDRYPPPSSNERGKPSITAALDSYLERMQSPQAQTQYGTPDAALYGDYRGSEEDQNPRPGPRAHDRYGCRDVGMRSPPPAGRFRSGNGGQAGPLYRGRPVEIEERLEVAYSPRRAEPSFVEPLPRHAEAERFALPAHPPNEHIRDRTAPEVDHRRYREDVRMHPRAAVEAYEIVHVIDEHGEYYIRRPARRDPDLRYVYEERRVRHGPDHYPPPPREPVYAHTHRPSSARFSAAPNIRPGDQRVDPAYWEEYDPRFPAG
ncbi:uncharacterized protein P884DRAFT_196759 [Thermothelomyces heterothallicus CBS 202.75]|uniref:uncharacterized protein n=1 Tax=Thermothelomyces heterothallicus CBS 202.75 TaxID=1149848 RepID=UPI0037434F49